MIPTLLELQSSATVKKIGSELRKARKTHTCHCGDSIYRNNSYYREVYLVDGVMTVIKCGFHIHWFERDSDYTDY